MIVGNLQGGNIAYADILTASKLDAVANAAATITITAITTALGTTEGRLIAHKVYWSYSADPTGGKLTITGGLNNFELDITKGGPGALSLGPYICSIGTNLVITLAAGSGAVVGKVNLDYTLRMFA